jgi:fibronectin-binding autotransporter adhesin
MRITLFIDGSSFRFNSAYTLNASRTVTIGLGGAAFDTNNGSVGIAGPVTGSGALFKTNNSTLTLSNAANNYTGDTYIFTGNLVTNTGPQGDIHHDSADAGGFSGANRILTFNQDFDGIYGGNIDGVGDLVKTGIGVVTFTGDHTYVGTTTVNAGALLVDGSINGAAVTVNAGATLGGSGTFASSVNVFGALAPGTSTGDVTVNGSLALNRGSTFSLELNGGAVGTGHDQLTIGPAGSVTISGSNLTLSLGFAPQSAGQTFTLIENFGVDSIFGEFANLADGGIISASFGGQTYDFIADYQGGSGNDLILTVPEPGSACTLIVALCSLAGLTRVRSSKARGA